MLTGRLVVLAAPRRSLSASEYADHDLPVP
jgi:hypothetical protein